MSLEKEIRIMIVDDHEMVVQGLQALFDSYSPLKVIASFRNGYDAVKSYEQVSPDVILMDINMPIINGFETSSMILEKFPTANILVLSMEVKESYIKKAMEIGIKGHLSKNADIEYLVDAIKKVSMGGLQYD